jgi:aerotaxis receptor
MAGQEKAEDRMRHQPSVNDVETPVPDGRFIYSRTDLNGTIVEANDLFVELSGYSREELVGRPHNVVRHPDMPKEAFADMWATLKNGEPWTALVKNRRKNGDHYWVRANAMPVIRHGKHAGYMSVRTKPSREEIAAAEALYRDFQAGKASGRRFHKGLIVRGGLLGWTSILQTMPVRWRIRTAMLTAWALRRSLAGPSASLAPRPPFAS